MFPMKDPRESITLTFDFTARGSSVSSVTINVRVVAGLDINPFAILDGSPQIDGARVLQKVKGGKNGCRYEFEVFAFVNGDRLLLEETLPVGYCSNQ